MSKSAPRYRNGQLSAHEAPVARHERQQAHARVGAQRVHDDVIDVNDAVAAGNDAEQARVLGQLDEADNIFARSSQISLKKWSSHFERYSIILTCNFTSAPMMNSKKDRSELA